MVMQRNFLEQLLQKDGEKPGVYIPHHGVYRKQKKISYIWLHSNISRHIPQQWAPSGSRSFQHTSGSSIAIRSRKGCNNGAHREYVSSSKNLSWSSWLLVLPLVAWWQHTQSWKNTGWKSISLEPFRRQAVPTVLYKESQINEYDEEVSTIKHNFYMDDCLKSIDPEERAITLVKELRCLCWRRI